MPSAAGFFGAFAPETSNITASQQEMYQRSLDRQRQMDEAMRNALENRRLNVELQMEQDRAALEKRKLDYEMAQVQHDQYRGTITSPIDKQELMVFQRPDGSFRYEKPPFGTGTEAEEFAKRVQTIQPDYVLGGKMTPETERVGEQMGWWKAPPAASRRSVTETFDQWYDIVRQEHPEWTDQQIRKEAAVRTSKIVAAEENIYTSRPPAAKRVEDLVNGMSPTEKRLLDVQAKQLMDQNKAMEQMIQKDYAVIMSPTGIYTDEQVKQYQKNADDLKQRIAANMELYEQMAQRIIAARPKQPGAGGQPAGGGQATGGGQPTGGAGPTSQATPGGLADVPQQGQSVMLPAWDPRMGPLPPGPAALGELANQGIYYSPSGVPGTQPPPLGTTRPGGIAYQSSQPGPRLGPNTGGRWIDAYQTQGGQAGPVTPPGPGEPLLGPNRGGKWVDATGRPAVVGQAPAAPKQPPFLSVRPREQPAPDGTIIRTLDGKTHIKRGGVWVPPL